MLKSLSHLAMSGAVKAAESEAQFTVNKGASETINSKLELNIDVLHINSNPSS